MPLTPAEENLLAECRHAHYLKPKERHYVDASGVFRIERTVDAEPIMDAMKAYGDILANSKSKVAGAKMVGSIDPITAAKWAKETGLKMHTREFVEFVGNRIKTDRDYRRFRVGH